MTEARAAFDERARVFGALVALRGPSLSPETRETVRRALVGLQQLLTIADAGGLSEEQVFKLAESLMSGVSMALLAESPSGRA